MAKMYQCDVCKNVYPGSGYLRLMLGKYDFVHHEFADCCMDLDVCPDCAKSIDLFIESKDPNHKSPFERDPSTG